MDPRSIDDYLDESARYLRDAGVPEEEIAARLTIADEFGDDDEDVD